MGLLVDSGVRGEQGELMQQPLASFWIVEQGLQTLTKGGHVPQRSLEGDECLAQLQQAVQLGNLLGDAIRGEIL